MEFNDRVERPHTEAAAKKAQSSMEYLMTYGWAILILGIVGVALYAMGVFNPMTFAGRSVTGFQVLGPMVDWEISSADGYLTLIIVNGRMSVPVTIHEVTATISGQDTSFATPGLVIGPGASDTITFPVTPALPKGSTYSVRVSIVYNSGGLNHTDFGTVTGTVN
jgi:hypothetical protein